MALWWLSPIHDVPARTRGHRSPAPAAVARAVGLSHETNELSHKGTTGSPDSLTLAMGTFESFEE